MKVFNFLKDNIITGVVSSSGSGGGKGTNQENWTFSFNFTSWYITDGDVCTKKLRVTKEVDDNDLKTLMKLVKKETIISISYLGDIKSGNIKMDEVIKSDLADYKLDEYLIEIRKEITYKDSKLGIFILNKSIDVFTTDIEWCGASAELFIDTDDIEKLKSRITVYNKNFYEQKKWDIKCKEYAADRLLELKNDCWLDDDEKLMTKDEFVRAISLETLEINEAGCYSFWFEDGDIFGGHVIIVTGDKDGLNDAEIAG